LSVTAGLILSNFPVAIALTIAWNRIETRNTVVIANEADVPATGVRVFGSGVDDDFGTLAPNKAKARSFRVTNTTDSDGPLFLSATLDGTSTTWSHGRVTEHVDSHFVVTLEGGGTIVVENEGVGNFRVDASGQSTRLDAPPFGARRTEPREGPPPTPADSR
jgi:hypothetical protein